MDDGRHSVSSRWPYASSALCASLLDWSVDAKSAPSRDFYIRAAGDQKLNLSSARLRNSRAEHIIEYHREVHAS